MSLTFADPADPSRPIHLVSETEAEAFVAARPPAEAAWLAAAGFAGKAGQIVVLPGSDGHPVAAVFGTGGAAARARKRFLFAAARDGLPEGTWAIADPLDPGAAAEAALGWLLAGYRFGRYKPAAPPKAQLICPPGVDGARIAAMAAAEALTRDLINTPASDMGPAELAAAALDLARRHGMAAEVIEGDDLLARGFPMIHAVGRASTRAPRLIDLRWGDSGPRVTLVGKGVCFDTGGLDLKPATAMGLMKKDMGGAATVLGLADLLMATGARLRLRVLIPAVENAVSGAAFRPGDVLTSRKGQTVEINNTDAEGRLVLADALAYADEEETDAIVSMATLTGAARVALGPDLAPFFTDDEVLAAALSRGGAAWADPVWRMPFHAPYEAMIEPAIADLDNAPSGGMAGAITAALFLRRFVTASPRYAHFDIYGWQPAAAPARPKGGDGQGARALSAALAEVLGT